MANNSTGTKLGAASLLNIHHMLHHAIPTFATGLLCEALVIAFAPCERRTCRFHCPVFIDKT